MSGNDSKFAVGEELAFKQTYSDSNIEQRLRIVDGANFDIDISPQEIAELTGSRSKSKQFKGILKGTGNFELPVTPNGGIGWLLKWLCGKVTTTAGSYLPRRLIATATGGETNVDFTSFSTNPVQATGHYCFLRHAAGTKTKLVASGSATPASGEYYVNASAKTVYFGAPLVAGDQVVLSWFETKAGVYSHVFKDYTSLKSFCATFLKGQIRKMNYIGCGLNGLTMNISTTDPLTAAFDALFADEQDGGTAASWPPSSASKLNIRDPKDPFLIKHCKMLVNQVKTAELQTFNITYGNNLTPWDTIDCTDITTRLVPGQFDMTASLTQEFLDLDARNAYRNLTLKDFEFRYGDCPGGAGVGGIQIGSTGINYQFGLWIPSGQYTTNSAPAVSGVMVESSEVMQISDVELDDTYEFYLINDQTGYPDAA